MTRIWLAAPALLVALALGGYWLVQTYPAETLGVLGALLLVIALFVPGAPACPGLHCGGCRRHRS